MRSLMVRFAGIASVAVLLAGCAAGPTQPPPSVSAGPSPTPTLAQTASPTPSPSPSPSPSPTPIPPVPAFNHIYVIVMENKESSRIVGSKAAPYENQLIANYGLATYYYGIRHPSEPNYIAMTSGGIQGVGSDGHFDLPAPNVFDQIEAAGRTWHVYAQNYPGNCYTGSVASGGADGWGAAGQYARKHNPAISYTSISRNKTRCANITRLKGFDPATADFEYIVPNQINDMHSSSVQAGDAFLKAFVPRIIGSPAFAGSALFITFDEGGTDKNGGGHVATIVVSSGMTPGARYTKFANHYSLLRTIEDAWGMPYLGLAAKAEPLALPYFG